VANPPVSVDDPSCQERTSATRHRFQTWPGSASHQLPSWPLASLGSNHGFHPAGTAVIKLISNNAFARMTSGVASASSQILIDHPPKEKHSYEREQHECAYGCRGRFRRSLPRLLATVFRNGWRPGVRLPGSLQGDCEEGPSVLLSCNPAIPVVERTRTSAVRETVVGRIGEPAHGVR
jgi:hypothetical protein